MPKMIFINLPVADVAASTAFYEAIGFTKNEQFSNEQAASMVWSDAIVVMLLARPFFSTFSPKQIVDSHSATAGHYALWFDSRAEVDTMSEAAVAAGGRELHGPEDQGFMYSRAFEDLDGHTFGPFWMEPAAAEAGPPEHKPLAA